MTGRGDYGLRYENFVADRAMLAFGQAGGCAGGGYCRVNYFGMAERGNLFRFSNCVAALIAHVTYSLACFGARGSYSYIRSVNVSIHSSINFNFFSNIKNNAFSGRKLFAVQIQLDFLFNRQLFGKHDVD